ncbi:MAG: RNA polymerase-binding protein DksA [Pseudomonadota bacterium]
MNKAQLGFFKDRLVQMKVDLEQHLEKAKSELIDREREADDLDRAQAEEGIHLKLRILDRESKLLPKIDESLKRIEEGSYGYCEATGEPIGIERLLVRPTAMFCAEEKNRQEQIEKAYKD